MQLFSNAHIECIINGVRQEGLADEDRPFEFPTAEDKVTVQVGADGGVYGSSQVMFGGEFMIRLQPNSPTTQFWVTENEIWKQANINGTALTVYSGTYSDPVQGRQASFQGGFLQRCADLPEPGETFEVVLYFERITANVDGATFNASLVSA